MKILDTQTGDIHEYGTDGHDSLRVSQDGRYLTYYNLQNGDGSGVGDYRFVCDDDKVPSESETADAIHAQVFFNIGGWNKRQKAHWIQSGSEKFYCSNCDNLRNVHDYYCEHCGSEMFDDNGNIIIRDWAGKEGGAE